MARQARQPRHAAHHHLRRARGGLGEAPDHTLYLRNPHEGICRLHPALRLDGASFQTLVAQGGHAGADGAAAPGAGAGPRPAAGVDRATLLRVGGGAPHRDRDRRRRGRPGPRRAVSCRRRPGRRDLGGTPGPARQPYDERLYRVLMRAAHTAAHTAGVDTVRRELLQVLGADDDPIDELHPLTSELYRKLRPRRSILT